MKPLFNQYDKVVRLDIEKPYVYTVQKIEESQEGYSYLIVRHPSPSKPHWTISHESDLKSSEEL